MDFYVTNMSRSAVRISLILLKKRKLFALIIHSMGAQVYTKKYIPVCISPYLGQIQCTVDNKKDYYHTLLVNNFDALLQTDLFSKIVFLLPDFML